MLINMEECQLLFVHLQDDILTSCTPDEKARICQAAGSLAELGSSLGIPMTFGLVPPEEGLAKPIKALLGYANDENTFHRQAASVFLDPPLAGRLDANHRPTLLIAGYATEVAVLHAALDALATTYNVYVAVDSIGGMSPRTERAALDQITRAGGEITSVASLLSMLAPDFAIEPGSTALRIIKSLGSR
ncbi:isochorismatase family protein [Sphingomonas sp. LB2R24]|uniref:isochorismatase family protein n=1 Tax=Sphingomonas sorbitolis TaxID=3096165 RepID=UPI002FC80294